jgi:uncharacterized protein (TIGR00730 family)
MTSLIENLLEDLSSDTAMSDERRALLRELLARVVAVAEADADTKDLRVAVTAIDELLDAFVLFDRWRGHHKLTIFGSARTPAGTPLYEMTVQLARAMAERGWITVTGGGPGIMEAAARGAGTANTLGVNIDLPFEQSPNAFIDVSTMLVTMKYFFTRKVALTRSSIAFVILPGGLGTMDELFEILTLLDTGKTTPAPVVLLDAPEGTYWQKWLTFVDEAVVKNDYLSSRELTLVRLATSVTEAIDEIEHFYSNYGDFAVDGERATISLRRVPTEEQLGELRRAVPIFDEGEGYRVQGEHALSFRFDGRSYVALRTVIDCVNDWSD